MILSCILTLAVCASIHVELLTSLFVRGIICCILPNVIYYLLFRNSEEYAQTLALVNSMTKGKLAPALKILGMKEN